MDLNVPLSRRRVVAGAAWTAPAVAVAAAAPAVAASPQNNYGLATWSYSRLYTQLDANGNRVITSLDFNDTSDVAPGFPAGFAAINLPQTGSTSLSPTTTATFTRGPVMSFAFPQNWFNSRPSVSDFQVTGAWAVDSVTEQTVNGVNSVVVQLSFQGVTVGQTVDDQDAGQIPAWPGSEFSVTTNPNRLGLYTGNFTAFQFTSGATYTTANGMTVDRDAPWQSRNIVIG
ncbi:hypothetical protein [Kytococcus sp. Marseille-QA3725]